MSASLKWTLLKDGDIAEQTAWVKIKDKFPNYEVFWSRFIVPMTCRELVPRDHPLWIHFRKDVAPALQHVAMSHYTVFRSLLFVDEVIYRQNSEDVLGALPFTYNERVDNAYIYLGVVIDMVENIFFNVHKIKEIVLNEKMSQKLSSDQIVDKAKDYVSNPNTYEKDFKNFIEKKKPVAIKLHLAGDLLLVQDQSLRNDFKRFCDNIRRYRNAIIHNPQMGTATDRNGVSWTPKKDKVEKYILWGNLFYYRDPADFVQSQDAMISDFNEMCSYLNRIWNDLIAQYDPVSSNDAYKPLLGHLPPLEMFYTPEDEPGPSSSPTLEFE